MLVASGRASIFCYQTFRLTQDPIADPQKGKILMNMSLDPASVFEKFPKNHTKKSTSPMIFCIGPQILNETDIFNGTCGSFLCLGCFSELGFFSVNLAASSTWCFFVFFVVAFRFLFLEASVGFWMHPHFVYEKKKVGHFKKTPLPQFRIPGISVAASRNNLVLYHAPWTPVHIRRGISKFASVICSIFAVIAYATMWFHVPFFGWGLGFIPGFVVFGAFLAERIWLSWSIRNWIEAQMGHFGDLPDTSRDSSGGKGVTVN